MDPVDYPIPFVESILHPSDFSSSSEDAFVHALKLAVLRKTQFTILHAGSDPATWGKFPRVRQTLERWGTLPSGSHRSDVGSKLGVSVKKVRTGGDDPFSSVMDYIDEHPADLIVLSTQTREGLPRWMKPSVAERLARGSDALTLFVPEKSSGFVSTKDGSMKLNRILVPIDHDPSPTAAIEYARRATALAAGGAEVIVLHVGRGEAPKLDIPDDGKWMMIHQEGDVVDVIVDRAREYKVDLIIMTTAGHDGFLDALRGSVTEQVLRKASRPLLAVPTSSFI